MDRPGTGKGYYLFVEDDAGCMVKQRSRQVIRDTDTEQHLPTDLIMEEEAAMYQVPEQDNQTMDDDAKTISLTSTADYDREEVETSLTTISEAFHTIVQEYEKLTGTILHDSEVTHITRSKTRNKNWKRQRPLGQSRLNLCLGPQWNSQLLRLKNW